MCKGILRLSWEVDKLHNEYLQILEHEKKIQLGHWLSDKALERMQEKQKELDKLIGMNLRGYMHVKESIPSFDVKI